MGWIEREAVRCFGGVFDRTGRLEPEIKEGEKGKITDGYVYVYTDLPNAQSDHSLRDGTFVGRVPVQVKGKELSEANDTLRSFSLERHELENIAKVGGTVLLVAGLPGLDSHTPTLHYADLAPDNARYVLDQMKPEQQKRAVKLKPFPTESDEIVSLFMVLQKRFSLRSVIDPNDDLMKSAEGLTVVTPGEVDYTRPQFFGGPGSSAIISVVQAGGEEQVINTILQVTPEDYGLIRNENLIVSCGDVEFDDTRKRKRNDGRVEFYLSPGISFDLERDGKCTFHLRFQRMLYYVHEDVKFLSALAKGESVRFNGIETLKFGGDTSKFETYIRTSTYLKELERLCQYFDIDPKLFPVADLPKPTIDQLRTLAANVLNGAEVRVNSTIPIRDSVDLLGKKIQLVWDETEGELRAHSFFDLSRMSLAAPLNDHGSGVKVVERVTAFEFFTDFDLTTILNLNPGQAVEGYRRIGGERAAELASFTVLRLLSAADKAFDRRRELLEIAKDLNAWVSSVLSEDIFVALNDLQIKFRLGELDDSDHDFLTKTWRSAKNLQFGQNSLAIELETSILLRKFEGVDYLLSQMDPEDRNGYVKSPVMFLYRLQEQYEVGEPSNATDWKRIEKEIEDEQIRELARYRLGKPTDYGQN